MLQEHQTYQDPPDQSRQQLQPDPPHAPTETNSKTRSKMKTQRVLEYGAGSCAGVPTGALPATKIVRLLFFFFFKKNIQTEKSSISETWLFTW